MENTGSTFDQTATFLDTKDTRLEYNTDIKESFIIFY